MATLRVVLAQRGYPYFDHIPYDSQVRAQLFKKLSERAEVHSRSDTEKVVLVFKAQYGVHLRELKILRECDKLYNALRQQIGPRFLHDVRTVVAHPVSSNAFLRSYPLNFAPGLGPKQRGNSGG